MTRRIAMDQAVAAYRDGNNRGQGYAPYSDVPGTGPIAHALACFQADGWVLVADRHTSDEVAIVRHETGAWMAIGGDALGQNAWAVDITSEVQS